MRYTGFRDRPYQPLRHPSVPAISELRRRRGGGRIQFTQTATFLEEFTEDFTTLRGEDPRRDRRAVIEPGVGNQAIQAGTGSGLRVGRAVDQPGDPAQYDR